MNGLLTVKQTSGNIWLSETARAYFGPEPPRVFRSRPVQLSHLHHLEMQMADFESEHAKLVAEVEKLYVVPQISTIRDFLRRHRRTPQVLIEAYPRLKRFFGAVVFHLEISSANDESEMLYTSAQWPGSPGDALRALESFNDSWWIANSYPTGSIVTFTYRLI